MTDTNENLQIHLLIEAMIDHLTRRYCWTHLEDVQMVKSSIQSYHQSALSYTYLVSLRESAKISQRERKCELKRAQVLKKILPYFFSSMVWTNFPDRVCNNKVSCKKSAHLDQKWARNGCFMMSPLLPSDFGVWLPKKPIRSPFRSPNELSFG